VPETYSKLLLVDVLTFEPVFKIGINQHAYIPAFSALSTRVEPLKLNINMF